MEEDLEVTTLIFDLGGVIFTNGSQIALERLQREYNICEKILIDIFYGENSWKLRRGGLTLSQYWSMIEKKYASGLSISTKFIEKIWFESYIVRKEILDKLYSMRPFFKTGVISGNIKERIEYLDKKYVFRQGFDFEVYTFDCKLDKIGEPLFLHAIKNYKLKPSTCFYIDDSADCIKTASDLGFKTYKFIDSINLINKLNELSEFANKRI